MFMSLLLFHHGVTSRTSVGSLTLIIRSSDKKLKSHRLYMAINVFTLPLAGVDVHNTYHQGERKRQFLRKPRGLYLQTNQHVSSIKDKNPESIY